MIRLQNFVFQFSKLPVESVWVQSTHPYNAEPSGISITNAKNSIGTLSFDGIGNAFPLGEMYHHAGVHEVKLKAEIIADDAFLSVIHVQSDGEPQPVFESHISGDNLEWESPWIKLNPGNGRYRVTLQFTGNLKFRNAAWWGNAVIDPELKFLVSITTFKREPYVLEILSDLCRYAPLLDFNVSFLVVDNGETLSADQLPKDERLFLISQPNLGGTGGYMRAVTYARSRSLDYLIISDDDIIVSPEMYYRMVVFNALSKSTKAIGAIYMTIDNPGIVVEKGAKIGFINDELIGKGVNLFSRLKLDSLYQDIRCDYSGWWLFSAPVALIQPLPPLFLRSDDILECLLLKKNGIPTIVPPHCFVWHASSALKKGPIHWKYYLHFRNWAILRLMVPELGSPVKVVILYLQIFFRCVINYDYDLAMVYIQALNDALIAPSWVQDPIGQAEQIHHLMKNGPVFMDLSLNISSKFENMLKLPRTKFFKLKRFFLYIITGANYLNPFCREYDEDGGLAFRNLDDYEGWGRIGYKKVAVIDWNKKGYICNRSWSKMISTTTWGIKSALIFLIKFKSTIHLLQKKNLVSYEIWEKTFNKLDQMSHAGFETLTGKGKSSSL